MLLYIVRHGDPIYETDSLTERGFRQAEAVGKRIAHSKIDKIFSSPMGRAKLTALPACKYLNKEMQIEEWTHEIEDERLTTYPNGVLQSITKLDNNLFRENGQEKLTYDEAFSVNAIKPTQMKKAVDFIEKNGNEFLEKLGYKYENGVYKILRKNEEKVALFCHSAFTKAWLSVLLHIPLHIVWSGLDITHSGVTIIEFKNHENGYTCPRCLCFSDTSHLYKEGLDLLHNNKIEM
jgi:probable phosphoglycerate mutase